MKLTNQLDYLRLTGNPYEVGRAHGEAMAPLIRFTYRKYRVPFYQDDVKQLQARLRFLVRETEKRFPEEIEEIRGIADGARLDFYQTFLINRHLGWAVKCTALAYTKCKQGPVAAGVLDDEPVYFLKDCHVTGQYRYLMSCWPGTLGGGNGMNEHGLTLMGTSAEPHYQPKLPEPKYLTDDFAIAGRILRSCRTVQEAIDFISRDDIGGHGNHILLDPSGEAACVEKRRHYFLGVRRPDENGFLFCVNYFASEYNTSERMKEIEAFNVDRLSVISKYRQSITPHNGLQVIQTILRDTTNTISNWPVSNDKTSLSCIVFPRRREMRVSDGPLHLGKFTTFTF